MSEWMFGVGGDCSRRKNRKLGQAVRLRSKGTEAEPTKHGPKNQRMWVIEGHAGMQNAKKTSKTRRRRPPPGGGRQV